MKKLENTKAAIQGKIKLNLYNNPNNIENNGIYNESMLETVLQQQLTSHDPYLDLLKQIEELELKEKQNKIEVEFLYNRIKLNQIYLRVGTFPITKERLREFIY